MRPVAIYEYQPSIPCSGGMRSAKPDRFLNSDEYQLKDRHRETLSSHSEGKAGS